MMCGDRRGRSIQKALGRRRQPESLIRLVKHELEVALLRLRFYLSLLLSRVHVVEFFHFFIQVGLLQI